MYTVVQCTINKYILYSLREYRHELNKLIDNAFAEIPDAMPLNEIAYDNMRVSLIYVNQILSQ